ncbi:MAG: exodeoxyribonuclease VII large subunit [Oscillospiraceae bacterium]|jgi:exodeoxyribonuclease VII large subunit|nr:exodeoxyribonuclease VII large subunit [Oscillospiraceae bacterium]
MDALTVSQVNRLVKGLLEKDETLQSLLVRGEISNYKRYTSGHHYFTLKDADCSLRCVMFMNDAARLRFTPADGMTVLAAGHLSVYQRDGQYQLYCASLMQAGEGDLTAAFEALKAKLAEEGLFDRAHKKPLPRYPMRVALVTSPSGAVVMDMVRIFRKRWPLCKLIVAPCRVQGQEAPGEIVSCLRYVNNNALADVIIVGRGGGSAEDLWAFNDERVARAIFASRIPVVSAVGHEPDVTIADHVADLRASTPSHAAELVSPDKDELTMRVASLRERLLRAPFTERASQNVRRLTDRLLRAFERQTLSCAQALAVSAGRLRALDPLRVLSRGYAIVTDESGVAVKDAQSLKAGCRVTVRPERGAAVCVVESVN